MKLRVTSTENFITFLKKLKAVEKSVLIEINESKTFAKVHTPNRSVMKYTSIENSEIFEGDIDWEDIGCDRIKIGVMDVTKLIDSFKHFRPEEDIFLELMISKLNDGDCVATTLNISSKTLIIKIRCADLSLLSYVEDGVLELVHSREDYLHKFKLYQSDFISIAALCNLETDKDELLEFDVFNDRINVKGNSFDFTLNIGEDEIEIDSETRENSVYKTEFALVDIETGDCYIHENRIVMFSDESDTSCAVGLVIK